MASSAMNARKASGALVTAYTVICKSGQRGIVFSDPGLAARAFFSAREEDRPFVLRHRGNATCVIASAKAGAKQIEPSVVAHDTFSAVFESLTKPETASRADNGSTKAGFA